MAWDDGATDDVVVPDPTVVAVPEVGGVPEATDVLAPGSPAIVVGFPPSDAEHAEMTSPNANKPGMRRRTCRNGTAPGVYPG